MISGYKPLHGFIEVICGPMFAEKSTYFLSQIRKHSIGFKIVAVFKPELEEVFDDDFIVTHNGDIVDAINIPHDNPNKILSMTPDAVDVVAIEEAQFFNNDIIEVVDALANRGIHVIVAGVDMDYRARPFEPMSSIIAMAEIVHKFTAVCEKCGNPATRIQRFTKGKLSHWDEPTVAVNEDSDGNFLYKALCRSCWRVPPRLIDGGKENDKK